MRFRHEKFCLCSPAEPSPGKAGLGKAAMAAGERSLAEKRLLENLQSDLRQLSNEAKKKHPPLREAAESGIIKVRNAAGKHHDLRLALLSESPEILEPFFLGCDTRSPKIVQICLAAIQRLVTFEAVSLTAAVNVITCLWNLMESGIEELKLLQTVTLLLTANSVVQGDTLAKALVLCFRLHFTKNSTTNNTASATVRQLVAAVFERVQAEDAALGDVKTDNLNLEELKAGSRHPPKSLQPCAADAFLLFQDLVQMVNADQPLWLIGLTEMTRTLGLELLESILASFPEAFLRHPEFRFLLKERVCPLVIKLFSPNARQAPDRPFFPISMRLVRVVSVLIHRFYATLVALAEQGSLPVPVRGSRVSCQLRQIRGNIMQKLSYTHEVYSPSQLEQSADWSHRGLGTDVAIVSSMMFPAQLLLSLCAGPLVGLAGGSVTAIMCGAAVLSACGALSATWVTYHNL
ncbi:hypothetical protein ISCGN_002753 [Ixodes scapularis]